MCWLWKEEDSNLAITCPTVLSQQHAQIITDPLHKASRLEHPVPSGSSKQISEFYPNPVCTCLHIQSPRHCSRKMIPSVQKSFLIMCAEHGQCPSSRSRLPESSISMGAQKKRAQDKPLSGFPLN